MKKPLLLLALCFQLVGSPSAARDVSVEVTYGMARPPSSAVADVRNFGAKCDGISDDTTAFQRATEHATASGKAVHIPGSDFPCIVSRIRTRSRMAWYGDGPALSKIRQKDRSNAPLLSPGSLEIVDDLTLVGIGFDGNAANNGPESDLIVSNGARPFFFNLSIKDVGGNAIITSAESSRAGQDLGQIGHFSKIVIDRTQKTAWIHVGPSDSVFESISISDASLLANGAYYGLYISQITNGKFDKFHYSNRDETENIPVAGVYIGSSGNTFSNSHFEGADTPLVVAAPANMISGAYYAPRGGYAVQALAGFNMISGVACIGATSRNKEYAGLRLASSHNIVNLNSSDCRKGAVDFTVSKGGNIVRIRGSQPIGSGYVGVPAATDDVDIFIDSAPLNGRLRHPAKF